MTFTEVERVEDADKVHDHVDEAIEANEVFLCNLLTINVDRIAATRFEFGRVEVLAVARQDVRKFTECGAISLAVLRNPFCLGSRVLCVIPTLMANTLVVSRMADPNADRPLPSYVEEVFAAIHPEIASTENGLEEDTARERLHADGFEPTTIDAAVDYLLLHGYLYEVDGRLRATTDTL